MAAVDWIILLGTLLFITIYGAWQTRGSKDIKSYLMGNYSMKWHTIGLSVMATQASAITFLSTPGQAFEDGMGFVQFYFGLPLAIIFLCVFILPFYYKLKVYTAYEFLEKRFDLKTRSLTAFLFLVQRGLAAGITIYAPSIVLSTILGIELVYTNLLIGVLVIIYTVSGGTKAVSKTQKQQMVVIMLGMLVAFGYLLALLPEKMGMKEALDVAGIMGKMEIVNTSLDTSERYTIWAGLLGGFFLSLSYFGTDQSQVQRYLSGQNLTAGKVGLLFNAVLKIPMQFFILLCGVMLFMVYQFEKPPIFFNQPAYVQIQQDEKLSGELKMLEARYDALHKAKKEAILSYLSLQEKGANAEELDDKRKSIASFNAGTQKVRSEVKLLVGKSEANLEKEDKDYIFLSFVLSYLPVGLVGLLLAVIFSAAMSSTASELNALASTTTVDLYKRSVKADGDEQHYVWASRLFTIAWGILAILFATYASLFENLIQAVNILGSIFYGTVLGVFIVAFFIRKVEGNAVFVAALISQTIVFILYYNTDISYLWYNVIGCLNVMVLGLVIQLFSAKKNNKD